MDWTGNWTGTHIIALDGVPIDGRRRLAELVSRGLLDETETLHSASQRLGLPIRYCTGVRQAARELALLSHHRRAAALLASREPHLLTLPAAALALQLDLPRHVARLILCRRGPSKAPRRAKPAVTRVLRLIERCEEEARHPTTDEVREALGSEWA